MVHQTFLSGVGTPTIDGTYNPNVAPDKLGAGLNFGKLVKQIGNGANTVYKVLDSPLGKKAVDFGVKKLMGGNIMYNHNKLILP